MPTVPRRTGPSVATSALPGVRAQGVQPDEGLDLSPVVRFATGVYQEEVRKADQIAELAADNALDALETSLRKRATQLKGREASSATELASAEWTKGVSEIEKSLNPRVKGAVLRRAQARQSRLVATAEAHADREIKAYDDAESTAALSNLINRGVEFYNNDDERTLAILEGKARIADKARRDGLGPEATAVMQSEFASNLHIGVIKRMLANNEDIAAETYYNENKVEIAGGQRGPLENLLQQGSTDGAALRHASTIMQTEGITRAQALARINEIGGDAPTDNDLEIRKKARHEIDLQFSAIERAQREQDEANSETAFGHVANGRKVPSDLFAALPAKVQIAVRDSERKLAQGTPVQTDIPTYYGLITAASDPDQQVNFMNLNLLAYKPLLGETEFKEVARIQRALRSGDTSEVRGPLTEKQVVEKHMTAARVFNTGNKKKDEARRATFWIDANAQLQAVKEKTKRKYLTEEEMQQVIEPMIVREVFKGTPSAPMTLQDIETDDNDNVYVEYDRIPEDDRSRIEGIIQGTRRDKPNKKKVQRAYARLVLDGRGLDRLIASGNRATLLKVLGVLD